MQAVILASGYGTRMRPISWFVPKPMIRVCGKNFIERNIEVLPEQVDEVVLVVGYLKEQIMNHFGDCFAGKRIKYAFQNEPKGTADALLKAKNLLKDRFIVMMGDDYIEAQDIKKLLSHELAVLVTPAESEFSGGKVVVDEHNNLVEIKEGKHKEGDLLNTNIFILDKDYFNYPPVALSNKEFGLPQTAVQMTQKRTIKAINASTWVQISDVDDLEKLRNLLAQKGKCDSCAGKV